jgi:tRNA/tmRNA/rRNA uracil-C5-methylase (TrmA/RlmC/RlmD family)
MVVVTPTAAGTHAPEGVTVVGDDELGRGHRAWIHEEVAGRRWRVSAKAFFQASPEGAEALVGAVRELIHAHAPEAERLVDLCCGVGLFAGTVAEGATVVGVERSAASVADARQNLGDLDARVVKVAMARWRPSPADVVVADPARSGLGKDGVAAVVGTGAQLCVLVSCDPAALGRDAALLAEAGYTHVGSQVVDLFGHTSHIEVVSGFTKRMEVGRAGA